MPDPGRQEKVFKFEQYNFEPRTSGRTAPKFHDNDVCSIRVVPAQKENQAGIVEIVFCDREEKVERILKLKECVNLRFAMDFDVLLANTSSPTNSAGQTSNVEVKNCNDCIERLLEQGMADWNVDYSRHQDTPASSKFWRLHEFILVKVILHGGTLEIVARDFEIINKSI